MVDNKNFSLGFIFALFIALLGGAGICGAGYFIGQGFFQSKQADRYVTVKGLVERDVKAELGTWLISFNAVGDDLVQMNQTIEVSRQKILQFIKQHGFTDEEITLQGTKVTDFYANEYQQTKPPHRYRIDSGVLIRSTKVDDIQAISQKSGELVKQGVLVTSSTDSDGANPAYFFNSVNALRPNMLAEATQNARGVAQQFSNDSGSRLGKIRRANQGVFQLFARDSSDTSSQDNWQISRAEKSAINKKIRLVITVDYYLEN